MSVGLWAECVPSVSPRRPQGQESEQDLYVKGWLSKVNNWATLWDFVCPEAISHSFCWMRQERQAILHSKASIWTKTIQQKMLQRNLWYSIVKWDLTVFIQTLFCNLLLLSVFQSVDFLSRYSKKPPETSMHSYLEWDDIKCLFCDTQFNVIRC